MASFRLVVPLVLAAQVAAQGLDPSQIRLPPRPDALLEAIKASPSVVQRAGPPLDPRQVIATTEAALRSPEREQDARRALLALCTPGPGGIHLAPADLVTLMERAFAHPSPRVRETGAVMAGVLYLRSRRRSVAEQALAAPGAVRALEAPSIDAASRTAVVRELNHGPGVGQHMKNAVRMNTERREVYAKLTGGRSRVVSDELIASEDGTLVGWTLATFDWLAADYNAQGVPLIKEDVIPLRPLPPHTPPVYRGKASPAVLADARRLVEGFVSDAKRHLGAREFEALAGRAYQAVVALQALEQRAGCHFAMTAHLVSTVGYGALRARKHAERARPVRWLFDWSYTGFDVSAAWVSAQYLKSTLYALPDFALEIDVAAQSIHHLHGVGIVVNEFPGGFFRHVWETRHLGE